MVFTVFIPKAKSASSTPLGQASRDGDIKAVHTLLGKDADVLNEHDMYGVTAVMYAAYAGHTNIVRS